VATLRPVDGNAIDPIALAPVDEVGVTTLVDNVYDALLGGDETVIRPRSRPERCAGSAGNPS
jgi:7,8-dihydropterin-6-yl-methyl-4-(beta-D-ribofuranosyl)aminobenzene 5'-phosphate synthase